MKKLTRDNEPITVELEKLLLSNINQIQFIYGGNMLSEDEKLLFGEFCGQVRLQREGKEFVYIKISDYTTTEKKSSKKKNFLST